MKPFNYCGTLPASKSLLNRLLITKSFFPELNVIGQSDCDDVRFMAKAIVDLHAGKPANCGDGAAVLRFLILRASRIPGRHYFTGSRRLLERPHAEIETLVRQLGGNLSRYDGGFQLDSNGWTADRASVVVDRSYSSQFASGLLLSCWQLPFVFSIMWSDETSVSDEYFLMTISLLQSLGMRCEYKNKSIVIDPKQEVNCREYQAESDLSSAFAVAVMAVMGGEARIKKFPVTSKQPDHCFPELLRAMGALVEWENDGLDSGASFRTLVIKKPEKFKPITFDLRSSPDLFPLLTVLAAFAEGTSRLHGAPHLIGKESNRIKKMHELLSLVGCRCDLLSDGIVIHGGEKKLKKVEAQFDPDHDHRIAMAAGLLALKGFPITINEPEVVNKSFPEFWQILRGTL